MSIRKLAVTCAAVMCFFSFNISASSYNQIDNANSTHNNAHFGGVVFE